MKKFWSKASDFTIGIAVLLAVFAAAKQLLSLTGLKFPAPIAGMVLLFALMSLRLVPMRATEAVCKLILDNMMLFFVPILVSLFLGGKLPKDGLMAIIFALAVSTVITLSATALSVEFLQKRRARASGGEREDAKTEDAR